ncbi:MAG: ribosomal protein L7/L12 [Bacteroidales bacterium]|nr:ribosomal protein L7/L12 [Candidatus Physcousia equi]
MNKRLLLLFTMVFALCCHDVYGITIHGSTKTGPIESANITQGTVTWNQTTRTLTLNNVRMKEGLSISSIDGVMPNVNIELIGDNVIDYTSGKETDRAIWFRCANVSIRSANGRKDGSLKAIGTKYGMDFDAMCTSFKVNDCSVELIADELAFCPFRNGKNSTVLDVTFDNASFYSHCTGNKINCEGISYAKNITLKNCELVTPSNFLIEDGLLYKYITPNKREIWKGDFQVKPRVPLDYSAILDDPNALYSLTLKSVPHQSMFYAIVAIAAQPELASQAQELVCTAPCVILRNATAEQVKELARILEGLECSVSIQKTGYQGVYFKNQYGDVWGFPRGIPVIKGNVTYDAENKILTLDNATIGDGSLCVNQDVTIELKGNNTITGDATDAALILDGANVTIQSTGKGTLHVAGQGDYALRHLGTDGHTLTVKDCDVVLNAAKYPLSGTMNASNEATLRVAIDHASFQAHTLGSSETERVSVSGVQEITLKGCVPEEPASFYFKNNDGFLYYKNESGKEMKWVNRFAVRRVETYGIKVLNQEVHNENCTDILGDGTVSYDPATHVLTLNNAHFDIDEYEHSFITFLPKPGTAFSNYTLRLLGENTMDGTMEDGLVCAIATENNVNLTIQGPGSLTITDPEIWIEDGRLTLEQEATLTLRYLYSGKGRLTVDNATLHLVDAENIGFGFVELVMGKGVMILTDDVVWNPETEMFEDDCRGWYEKGNLTIGVAKGDYQVTLENSGTKRGNVMTVLENIFLITVYEAEDLIDSTPCVLIEGCSQKYAEMLAQALRNAGATVEVKNMNEGEDDDDEEEETETGIAGTSASPLQSTIYDLQGRQLRSLPVAGARGLYIVNGKKVLR